MISDIPVELVNEVDWTGVHEVAVCLHSISEVHTVLAGAEIMDPPAGVKKGAKRS